MRSVFLLSTFAIYSFEFIRQVPLFGFNVWHHVCLQTQKQTRWTFNYKDIIEGNICCYFCCCCCWFSFFPLCLTHSDRCARQLDNNAVMHLDDIFLAQLKNLRALRLEGNMLQRVPTETLTGLPTLEILWVLFISSPLFFSPSLFFGGFFYLSVGERDFSLFFLFIITHRCFIWGDGFLLFWFVKRAVEKKKPFVEKVGNDEKKKPKKYFEKKRLNFSAEIGKHQWFFFLNGINDFIWTNSMISFEPNRLLFKIYLQNAHQIGHSYTNKFTRNIHSHATSIFQSMVNS